MAVVKVFDCNGVKTVSMMDNVMDQDYDPPVDDAADFELEEDE